MTFCCMTCADSESEQVTDDRMSTLQLSEDRYQNILSKCRSKVISAEQQVSMTASFRGAK